MSDDISEFVALFVKQVKVKYPVISLILSPCSLNICQWMMIQFHWQFSLRRQPFIIRQLSFGYHEVKKGANGTRMVLENVTPQGLVILCSNVFNE